MEVLAMTVQVENFFTGFKRGIEQDGGTVKDMGAKLLSTIFWCISLLFSGAIVSQFWNTIATVHDLPATTPLVGVMIMLLSHLIFRRRIRMVRYCEEYSLYLGKIMGTYFAIPLILWMVALIARLIF